MKNPIIAELRRIRDARARKHNYDIEEMARDLTQLEPWMEKKTYTLTPNGRFRAKFHPAWQPSISTAWRSLSGCRAK